MPQNRTPTPSLSPDRAFVVQLRTDTRVEAGSLAGRIEHVVSGQATTFQSLEALFTFMVRVLREGRDVSWEGKG
jgi:hypothetical protein